MSNNFAIRLTNVGKMYKLYPSRQANFFEALGIARLLPPKYHKFAEFWALRTINLELGRGQRLGIIGRNGAGKSTLLKLITGNFAPTEGTIEVKGEVQALFEIGAGFHPEFTGYENIRASLTYQGLSPKEIESAIEDIADFTELGPFLEQPFKTYSVGMQARLGFATATAIKPAILIVDEILGTGDAYFAGKSVERMRRLAIESNASVLIASHALSEIIRYCEETIWIERGRIVKHGPSMDVVAAYEGFIHTLEDRRLRARNRKMMRGVKSSFQLDYYSDSLSLAFVLQGEAGAACDISHIQLLKNGKIEDELRVGDAQDTNTSFSACLIMEGSRWSDVRHEDAGYFRSLVVRTDPPVAQVGYAVFYSYGLFGEESYTLQVRYRCPPSARVSLTITKNGENIQEPVTLSHSNSQWTETELALKIGEPKPAAESQKPVVQLLPSDENQKNMAEPSPTVEVQQLETEPAPPDKSQKPMAELPPSDESQKREAELPSEASKKTHPIIHWPSESSLTIEKVTLRGANGEEQFVFRVGSPMTLSMKVMAHRLGHFNLVLAAVLYRLDGILISKFIGEPVPLDMGNGEMREFRLEIPSLNLGDGNFVFAVAIYERLVSGESRYDLIDRCYEFKIIGNDREVSQTIFQHDGTWKSL